MPFYVIRFPASTLCGFGCRELYCPSSSLGLVHCQNALTFATCHVMTCHDLSLHGRALSCSILDGAVPAHIAVNLHPGVCQSARRFLGIDATYLNESLHRNASLRPASPGKKFCSAQWMRSMHVDFTSLPSLLDSVPPATWQIPTSSNLLVPRAEKREFKEAETKEVKKGQKRPADPKE